MEPKHYPDALRHLEKQNEVLMEAYRSLSYELRRLQTENTKKKKNDEGLAGEHQVN